MGKPAFDPNKPFETIAEKPAFDPSAPFESVEPPKKTRADQTALESYGNAATLGYLPHIQALTELNPGEAVDADLSAKGFRVNQPGQSYVARRDANIARQAEQRREHPFAAGAGAAAGILASAVGTGGLGAVAKGASAVQRLRAARNAGAIIGAAANPGDTEGEIDPLQVGARAKGGVIGAATGIGGQALAEGAGALSGFVSRWASEKAAKAAARAVGRPTPTMAAKMAKSGDDIKMGRELLDQGAIPILGTPGRIAKRVERLRDKSWAEVEKLLKSHGDEAVVDGAEAAKRISSSDEYALLKEAGETQSVAALDEAADQLKGMGKVTLEKAQRIKKTLDGKINYDRKNPTAGATQEGRFAKRSALRDQMDASAGIPGELKSKLKKQGLLEKAAEIGEREAGSAQANHKVSLTDVIAAAGGFASGKEYQDKGLYAAALLALNKGRRAVGPAMAARTYDAIAKQLARVPQFAQMAEKNPAGFSALIQRLSEKFRGGGGAQLRPQFADDQKNEAERGVASQPYDMFAPQRKRGK